MTSRMGREIYFVYSLGMGHLFLGSFQECSLTCVGKGQGQCVVVRDDVLVRDNVLWSGTMCW